MLWKLLTHEQKVKLVKRWVKDGNWHTPKVARTGISLLVFCAICAICGESFAENVTLTWDRNSEPEATGYRLYWTADPVFWPLETHAGRVVGLTNYYTLSNLCAGCTYEFGVKATNEAGESDMSATVSYVVPLPTNRVTAFSVWKATTVNGPWQIVNTPPIVLTNNIETTNVLFRVKIESFK